MAGKVRIGGKPIEKPGTIVDTGEPLEVAKKKFYVSRGGIKLEGAFDDFGINAGGKKAIDVGSSTGGFTDFLLKNGAEKVICIDVGYGQLSWRLRKSPRVIVLERTNIRKLETEKLPYKSDIKVADLSFISIKTVFKKVMGLTAPGGKILLMIKPQFELKKDEVENGGVIKNRKLHLKTLMELTEYIRRFPVIIKGFTYSKIRGAKGNMEFWIFLIKTDKEGKSTTNYDKIIRDVVEKAHFYFNKS